MSDFENWITRAKQDYIDLVFRWLAACRDYPYAQHARPTSAQLSDLFCNMVIEQCAREFVRSNTGFICPST